MTRLWLRLGRCLYYDYKQITSGYFCLPLASTCLVYFCISKATYYNVLFYKKVLLYLTLIKLFFKISFPSWCKNAPCTLTSIYKSQYKPETLMFVYTYINKERSKQVCPFWCNIAKLSRRASFEKKIIYMAKKSLLIVTRLFYFFVTLLLSRSSNFTF